MFGALRPLPQEEYLHVYASTGIDVDGRRAIVNKNKHRYEDWYRNYISFAKSLPHFSELPMQDQVAILKGACARSGCCFCRSLRFC